MVDGFQSKQDIESKYWWFIYSSDSEIVNDRCHTLNATPLTVYILGIDKALEFVRYLKTFDL